MRKRNIIFRGWDCVGNKGWVYGDLVHNKKVTKKDLEDRVMVAGYEVEPESVGMNTGHQDRKGNEIFEGDIVSVFYNDKHIYDATVFWHDGVAGFLMEDEENDAGYSTLAPSEYIEISGNVYEKNKL